MPAAHARTGPHRTSHGTAAEPDIRPGVDHRKVRLTAAHAGYGAMALGSVSEPQGGTMVALVALGGTARASRAGESGSTAPRCRALSRGLQRAQRGSFQGRAQNRGS